MFLNFTISKFSGVIFNSFWKRKSLSNYEMSFERSSAKSEYSLRITSIKFLILLKSPCWLILNIAFYEHFRKSRHIWDELFISKNYFQKFVLWASPCWLEPSGRQTEWPGNFLLGGFLYICRTFLNRGSNFLRNFGQWRHSEVVKGKFKATLSPMLAGCLCEDHRLQNRSV